MAADNEKDLEQLKKRIKELAAKSDAQNIYTYTGFLSIAEQDVFHRMEKEVAGIPSMLYGGNADCERQMLRFGNAEKRGYEENFPITCILAEPVNDKFADDFTHRDFLGAVMNLGIERTTVGDIFMEGKSAYLFCMDKVAAFIIENLEKVKHTKMQCRIAEGSAQLTLREPVRENYTVSSERADGIAAKIYHLSRNESLSLFRERKIFINGKMTENNSYQLKSGDIVSVRGYGRFTYGGADHETKKGKISITVGVCR